MEQEIPQFLSDSSKQRLQVIKHYYKRHGVKSSSDETLMQISFLPDEIRVNLSRMNIYAEKSYQSLEEIIVEKLKPSDEEATGNLFSCIQLSSRESSNLHKKMLCLLGDRRMDKVIIRELWVGELSSLMHPSFAAASKLTIEELVEEVDNVFEATRSTTRDLPVVSNIQNVNSDDFSLVKLYEEIMAIKG